MLDKLKKRCKIYYLFSKFNFRPVKKTIMKKTYVAPILNIIFLLLIVFLANEYSLGQIAEIENRVPKNVPVKIEIKNNDREDWAHKLEIKVTNIGKKPIYFLFLSFELDEISPQGGKYGFALTYGKGHLYSTIGLAQEEDIPILPDETYTFKIRKNSADARMFRKKRENFVDPQKAFLEFGFISFGDGTGVRGGGVPFKKKL